MKLMPIEDLKRLPVKVGAFFILINTIYNTNNHKLTTFQTNPIYLLTSKLSSYRHESLKNTFLSTKNSGKTIVYILQNA